jgi:hypothetical protein
MANSSNWDTYSESPKKGMGTLAKVLICCCTVALLLLGGCVGLGYWATHSGREAVRGFVSAKVSSLVEARWSKIVEVAEAIKTDEGALKLYKENHRLAAPHQSGEAFLRQAKVWRSALSELPTTPPSIDLLNSGKFEISQRQKNKSKFLSIRYEMPDKTLVILNWEDEDLVGIELR